jgi:hypothetical protein
MAKKCEVCKRTYPDTEPSCPYCAEAIDIVLEEEAGAAPGKTPPAPFDDSSGVNLAEPAEPTSDISNVKWVDLVDSKDDSSGIEVIEEGAVEVDSPSEADIRLEAEKEAKIQPPKTVPPTQLAGKGGTPTMIAPGGADEDVIDAVLDTSEEKPTEPPAKKPGAPVTQLAGKSPVQTQLASPAGIHEVMEPVPGEETPAGSEKQAKKREPKEKARRPGPVPDMQLEEGAEVVEAESADQPGALTHKPGPEDIPVEEVVDADLAAEEILVESSSEINLGSGPPKVPGTSSGVGSGVEVVDSGVGSGVEVVESDVDLGKPADVEEAAAAALAEESSAVNLGEPPPARSSLMAEDSGGKETGEEIAAVEEPVEEVAEGAPESGVKPKPAKRPRSKMGKEVLVGALVGVLGTVGIGAGLVFAKVLSFGSSPSSPNVGRPGGNIPIKSPVDKAHSFMDDGEFAKAVEVLDKDQTPEGMNLRAQARWMAYLKTQTEKKAPLKKDDPEVQKVLDDLTKTKNNLMKEQVESRFKADQPKDTGAKEKAIVQALLQKLNQKDQDKVVQTVDKALKDLKDSSAQVGKLNNDLKKANTDLTDLKEEKDKLDKSVKALDTAKKEAENQLAKANKEVGGMKKDLTEVKAAQAKLAQLVADIRKKLRAAKYLGANANTDKELATAMDLTLKQAVSPLTSGVAELADTLGGAGASVGQALAQTFSLARWTAAREGQLAYYKAREPMVQTPEKMLDYWIPLLQNRDHKDAKAVAEKASRDAQWVLVRDLTADAQARAKASYVLGLAERNQGHYAKAKELLAKAAAGPAQANDPAWRKQARQAAGELTDSAAFQQRYEKLVSQKQTGKLVDEITGALEVAKDKGSLLALRALARLEGAVKAGDLKAGGSVVNQVRKDAEDAIKAGAVGEGNYTLGRLDEELGDLPGAVKHYQLAVSKYSGQKKLEGVYRLALARVLLQTKSEPAQDKKGGKGPEKRAQGGKRKRALPVLSVNACPLATNATLLMTEDDEEDPYQNPNVDQAIKLAQEAIERGEQEGYLLLGQALTQKGKWTEGLQTYITGLEKTLPGAQTKGLRRIVEGHPAFKRPDGVKPPQPVLAQKFYNNGLNFYWNRKFDKAEAEFLQAVKYYDQDARYLYFLGLSRLRQQKTDKLAAAYEDFRLAHRLEEEGNPDADTVNDALEKVQGKARRVLDNFRKPRRVEE